MIVKFVCLVVFPLVLVLFITYKYSGVPYRLQGTASTTPPINAVKRKRCGVCLSTVSEDSLPDSFPLTCRPHHADDPRQNDAAWVDFAGLSQGADGRCSRLDAGRGRVLESMS